MLIIPGYLLILLSVFGGFALAGGHLAALFQPVELLIIAGAASGAFVVANSFKIIKATLSAVLGLFKPFAYNKTFYLQLLSFLFVVTTKIRREGIVSIEADVNEPHQSLLFSDFPLVLKHPVVIEFIQDYLRLMVAGTADFHQMENLMDNEIETHHQESELAIQAVTRLADGMPAFGIVAAVMGVVHTMESVSLPPSELGALVAKALVGTFLGILIGYGFVAPLASLLENQLQASSKALACVKVTLLATLQHAVPAIAVEFGRKILFSTEKPSNTQLETRVRELKSK